MAKRRFYKAANRVIPRDIFCLLGAVGCATFGLQGFLLPNGFLDGGVTGLALIARAVTQLPMPILLVLFNLPFIFMGRYSVSRVFAVKTIGAISLLAISLTFAQLPVVTSDPLLVSVFGGFFLGLGIGLAIRGGGVIDGTEILAIFIAKYAHITVGQVIMFLNVAIFMLAATVFDTETALYAMLTYLCASRTVDFIVHGLDDYTAIQIHSEHNASIIHKMLKRSLGLNVTVVPAQKGDPSRPDKATSRPILQVIVRRLRAQEVLSVVQNVDPKATVIFHPITDVHGRI